MTAKLSDWSIELIDMPRPEHFHVHACASGRRVVMDVHLDDHPNLREAFDRFREAMTVTVASVMYDMAVPDIPETMDDIPMAPCRICDRPGTRRMGASYYCDDHGPRG